MRVPKNGLVFFNGKSYGWVWGTSNLGDLQMIVKQDYSLDKKKPFI